MARPASVAKAGFYPTPEHLIESICKLIRVEPADSSKNDRDYCLVDPCCGEGVALGHVSRAINQERRRTQTRLYGCELSKKRFDRIEWNYAWKNAVVCGDAFHVKFTSGFASLLWLNPPYDTDSEFRRLEERFLRRFMNVLGSGGVLVYIVPYYALLASAETLAKEFDQVRVFKFPADDFAVFKQIVLVARRCSTVSSNESILSTLLNLGNHPDAIPELPPVPEPIIDLPRVDSGSIEWALAPLDITKVLSEFTPWSGVAGVVPTINERTPYPTATPLRPAHISAGIAAGLFDGLLLETKDHPTLLVKGVFDRDYLTIDEKRNKDGDCVGEVQAQAPTLRVSVLDCDAGVVRSLKAVSDRTTGLETFGDLLALYERPLLQALSEQCPVTHTSTDPVEVSPRVVRKLYKAQAHAATALTKLLRRDRAALLLGEIGSGKTSCALAASANVESRRTLVMCPPHLLDSWRDQCAAVLPDARTVVLQSPDDLQALASDSSPGQIIAILSRETAKLGHPWIGVGGRCSRCGADQEDPPDKQARLRLRCKAINSRPTNIFARAVVRLATIVIRTHAGHRVVDHVLDGRMIRDWLQKLTKAPFEPTEEYIKSRSQKLTRFLYTLFTALGEVDNTRQPVVVRILTLLLHVIDDPTVTVALARKLFIGASIGNDQSLRHHAFYWLLMTPVEHRLRELREWSKWPDIHYWGDDIKYAWPKLQIIAEKPGIPDEYQYESIKKPDDPIGEALEKLNDMGHWNNSKPCGEVLFQADSSLRRVALATVITKRFPKLFDLFLADECQDYGNDGSAQERAAHRICALGLPTVMMTGSLMNGYARSLFTNLWSISAAFRASFKRDEAEEFVRKYGYKKRIIETKEGNKVVAYGSVSDRVTTNERDIGDAPGVLPHAILKYILPIAVTLQQSDLELELPTHHELVAKITPSKVLESRYRDLQNKLVTQIRRDAFGPLAGKLWGALAELPSYLDRATSDTGNTEDGRYEIRYPESPQCAPTLVAEAQPFPAEEILPKEQWVLDCIKRELSEGRRVMVFAWHLTLMPRLARIIKGHINEPVAMLEASKVSAGKRQSWIDSQVIAKKRRVLIVNPVAVQTGLNNLVWFQSVIWYQNPACNPLIYRQANGRIRRIGQTAESRVYFPVYENTAQEQLHKLLMTKVSVSVATDGLDAESAMIAAGAGENTARLGLSIGKQLYEMLGGR